jgi:4-oxalocrotonate tautomerase family enzyme
MPLVKIEVIKGHTEEYKKLLLQTVHDALESALSIPEWDRFQRLYEVENDYFERDNTETDTFALIELTLFPGRSREIKKSVIVEITRLLGERLSIPPGDIYIVINEPPLDNWGMNGTQASEMALNYKTENT